MKFEVMRCVCPSWAVCSSLWNSDVLHSSCRCKAYSEQMILFGLIIVAYHFKKGMTSKMNAVLEDHYPAGYTGKRLNATLTAHYKNQATRELHIIQMRHLKDKEYQEEEKTPSRPTTPWINSYQSAVVRNNSSTLLQDETYKPAGYSGHIAQSQEHFGKTMGQVVR